MQPGARARFVGLICAGEALLCFFLPTLANPRQVELTLDGVHYLQQTLGTARFFTLGPIQPNYGAYYGLAGINHNDLPVPRAWADYVTANLDPNTDPLTFNAINRLQPDGPTAADNLVRNLAQFEKVGVKYMVARAGLDPFGWTGDAIPLNQQPIGFVDMTGPALASLPAPPSGATITGVAVDVRNSRGKADGQLTVKLCSGEICGEGSRDLSELLDNNAFMVPLAAAIAVPPGPLTVELRQINATSRAAVGVWSTKSGGGQSLTMDGKPVPERELRLLIETGGSNRPNRVFTDKIMTIYALANPRAYFSADGCVLEALSRDEATSDCAAPSHLLRLENFDRGWSASVNGTRQEVTRTERIFQQVELPAGHSVIRFAFTPPGMVAGYAAFGLALLALVAGWIIALGGRFTDKE